tara:strand:+ start:212 stop:535 length:324 start_codon:yes stop_codon:yes gene_type:complete
MSMNDEKAMELLEIMSRHATVISEIIDREAREAIGDSRRAILYRERWGVDETEYEVGASAEELNAQSEASIERARELRRFAKLLYEAYLESSTPAMLDFIRRQRDDA